jgi:K+-sensing histidine kinase KdpD
MRFIGRTAATFASLAITLAATVILAELKGTQHGPQHLIFFYLAPTAFVAILYGSVLSMASAILATLVAAFFLYEPINSFYVSDPRELGELFWFGIVGLLGAKSMAALLRSPQKPF